MNIFIVLLQDISNFSRDFAEFSESNVSAEIQELTEKTYLGPSGVFHVSHDSTAIKAREKGKPKERRSKQEKKTDVSPDEKSVSRIEGKREQWKGYKLHITSGFGTPLHRFCKFLNEQIVRVQTPEPVVR